MHAIQYLKQPETPTGPLVALFGTERFLKLAAQAALIERTLPGENGEAGLIRFAAKDVDLATVLDTLSTISMWSPRQVVLVEDADAFVSEHRAALERYLERPARKSVLVLDVKTWMASTRLAKRTAEIGLPIECSPLKPAEVVGWLVEACKSRHQGRMDRAAAQQLVELAGTDLGLLDQELEKLAVAAGPKGVISAELVRSLVGGWRAETTWSMLDAVRDGHPGAALQLLDKLLDAGEPILKLLGGVNAVFRPVARAAELTRLGMPLGPALHEAGVKPFNHNGMMAYLKRIGRPRAEQISQWLLAADMDAKGRTPLSERLILERLLLQLSGTA